MSGRCFFWIELLGSSCGRGDRDVLLVRHEALGGPIAFFPACAGRPNCPPRIELLALGVAVAYTLADSLCLAFDGPRPWEFLADGSQVTFGDHDPVLLWFGARVGSFRPIARNRWGAEVELLARR